jgi:intracellular sulfur oxidation DsrE/DsrF family protein
MSLPSLAAVARRVLVLGAIATSALIGGMAVSGPVAEVHAGATANRHDAWLTKLDGKHRQLFDAPSPDGGIPLVHVLNYYDTFNAAFGVADRDVDAVLTFYGKTTFHGLNDAMWAKYDLGAFLGENDASGRAHTANPWRANPTIIGMSLPQASIESLQKRGASFIICNNALSIFSGLVARSRGLDAKVVYDDMKANILPGVTLVPAMVIAIGQAQNAGLTYHRQ